MMGDEGRALADVCVRVLHMLFRIAGYEPCLYRLHGGSG